MCCKLQEEGLLLNHSVSLLLDMPGFYRAHLPVTWGVVTNKQVMCISDGFKAKYVTGW